MIKISMVEVVGRYCCFPADAQMVYKLLKDNLRNKQPMSISFARVHCFTPLFASIAFGQLYKDYSARTIEKKIQFTGMDKGFAHLYQSGLKKARGEYGQQ